MKKQIEQIKEFYKAFEIPFSEKPTHLDADRFVLRFDLAKEELNEYWDAELERDLIGVKDAIADQLYILLGTAHEHGIIDELEEIFNEVHRSNMSKLGLDGKPIIREDGKILKGPNYFKPNIK